MKAFLFPGQGSQVKGMGAELFDEFPAITTAADSVLGYSIKSLCLNDADDLLNLTRYTQPALYTVNALSYFKKIQVEGKPDFVAGHSLGEYNALLAADVFDFVTGLELVKKRGELMSQARDGAMTAVMGFHKKDLEQWLNDQQLTSVTIANHNSYKQCVLSGPAGDLEKTKLLMTKESTVRVIPLKVSGAFHSQLMQEAENQFIDFLNQFTFSTPALPVISNVEAKPYHPLITKSHLTKQITHTVQWVSSMEYLLANPTITLEEIGPGQVLTGLLKRMQIGE